MEIQGNDIVFKTKSIYQSKTFWFNMLTIIVTIAASFGFVPDVELTQQTQTALVGAFALVNIFLRVVTNQAVTV
jgi:hypothetical protein